MSTSSLPSTSLGANDGSGTNAGRFSTWPSVRANSAFVTGLGDGEVDRSGHLAVEQVLDRADLVVDRDPAHPLPAVAGPATEPELVERQHLAERTTLRRQHHAGAQMGDAHAGRGGRGRARLPCRADLGEEAGAGGRRLVDGRVALIAVEVDARSRQQHAWTVRRHGPSSRRSGSSREFGCRGSDACRSRSIGGRRSRHRRGSRRRPRRLRSAGSSVPCSGSQADLARVRDPPDDGDDVVALAERAAPATRCPIRPLEPVIATRIGDDANALTCSRTPACARLLADMPSVAFALHERRFRLDVTRRHAAPACDAIRRWSVTASATAAATSAGRPVRRPYLRHRTSPSSPARRR